MTNLMMTKVITCVEVVTLWQGGVSKVSYWWSYCNKVTYVSPTTNWHLSSQHGLLASYGWRKVPPDTKSRRIYEYLISSRREPTRGGHLTWGLRIVLKRLTVNSYAMKSSDFDRKLYNERLSDFSPQKILFGSWNNEEWEGGSLQHARETDRVHTGFGEETWGQQTTWKYWSRRKHSRLRLKCDGTGAETRFRLSPKRTSPFKSAEGGGWGRQFSRLLAAEVCASAVVMVVMLDTSCSEVEYKTTGYPLHSHVSASLPLPWVTACHHISTGLY